MSMEFAVSGNLVDLMREEIFPATVEVAEGRIQKIHPEDRSYPTYLIPGFIDSHVHIESSLMVPSEFARLAVVRGTVATVSDPHEIANVLGRKGVDFMIENGSRVPFKFFFGAPSCVPATPFETAGGRLDAGEVTALLEREDIRYLSEMMNVPGVIAGDPEVMEKIGTARRLGKPVDGHAPGLRGEGLRKYAAAGISTDHESFTLAEALEKLEAGMKIAIREGSAARNFADLVDLLGEHASRCMFCSDDKHADSLLVGHMDELVRRAIRAGHQPLKVLCCASSNPKNHYDLPVGLLQEGDPADFLEVSDLQNLRVIRTYIDGRKVAEHGKTLIDHFDVVPVNNFMARPVSASDFRVRATGRKLRVIEAVDCQLVTRQRFEQEKNDGGWAVADPQRDLLKIAVVNRYQPTAPSVAFVRNFGLRKGALASSVAHDSHNIIAVGTTDQALAAAVNLVIRNEGGLVACDGEGREEILPLPVAGLMSGEDGYRTASRYTRLDHLAKSLGSRLTAPFMTLSFMALLVIPSLKISDKGLFDGDNFGFVPLTE